MRTCDALDDLGDASWQIAEKDHYRGYRHPANMNRNSDADVPGKVPI